MIEKRSRFWQVRSFRINLATLLILCPLLACGLVYWINSYRIARLQAKLKTMYQLADELQVMDPTLVAARKTIRSEEDNLHWQVHVPAGSKWLLKFSTTPPPDNSGYTVSPIVDMAIELSPGTMDLSLYIERASPTARFSLTRNGEPQGHCEKPSLGFSGGTIALATLGEATRHFSRHEVPFLLFREYVADGIRKPTQGVYLWLEAESDIAR